MRRRIRESITKYMTNLNVNNIGIKIKQLAGKPWQPLEFGRVNDQVLQLALFKGEYHWHKHDAEELFYVAIGQITIQFKDRKDVVLGPGDICVVPKGVLHCPKSAGESYVLMVEPENLKSITLE